MCAGHERSWLTARRTAAVWRAPHSGSGWNGTEEVSIKANRHLKRTILEEDALRAFFRTS